jgi:glycosyltransferase involved in cell wall biosynthesis
MILSYRGENKKMGTRVVFFGPLPPPINGMAAVNERVLSLLYQRSAKVCVIDTSRKSDESLMHVVVKRIYATIVSPLILAISYLRGYRKVYLSLNDGLGIMIMIPFLLLCRILNLEVYIHHHSFKYIVNKSHLVSIITLISGPLSTHIFLCQCMLEQFSKRYGGRFKNYVIPNTVAHPPEPMDKVAENRPFTIGLLSNLTIEKGLGDFLQLLAQCPDIRGVLAGPILGSVENDLYIEAAKLLGDRLIYLGTVHPNKKSEFFEKLDLFVFPTRYKTEAYPLVLLESLSHGVPFSSWERGCINELSNLNSSIVIPSDNDFVFEMKKILSCGEKRQRIKEKKLIARIEGEDLNEKNTLILNAFINKLTMV